MLSDRDIRIMTFLYILAIPVVALTTWQFVQIDPVQRIEGGDIDNATEKALELSINVITLFISLATGSVAVCAWLVTRPRTTVQEFRQRLSLTALAIVALCCSIYFGVVALDGALELLAWQVFDSRSDLVWWPQTLQYYSFLLGVLVFGLAALRSINAVAETE
jgi:hypothetical protein